MVSTNEERGLTIIEIAIAIMIIGFIVAGFAQAFKFILIEKQETAMDNKYKVIHNALSNYIKDDPEDLTDDANFPCPASPTLSMDDVNFGIELRSGSNCLTESGVVSVVGTGGQQVFIGAVPTRTLQIGSANALDVLKNRFTYAVSENASETDVFATTNTVVGAITIKDNGGAVITDTAPFTLISHGPDGKGAFTAGGVRTAECTGDTGDLENCDGDAEFNDIEIALAEGADFYDDRLSFSLADAENDDFWGVRSNGQDIFNKNSGLVEVSNDLNVGGIALVSGDLGVQGSFGAGGDAAIVGNVGIGVSEPKSRVQIAGEVQIADQGRVCTAELEGSIRYNFTSKNIEFCDGVDWRSTGGDTLVASGINVDDDVVNLADHDFDPDGNNPHIIVAARDHNHTGINGNTEDASFCGFEKVSKLEFRINCRASTASVGGFNAPSQASWMAVQNSVNDASVFVPEPVPVFEVTCGAITAHTASGPLFQFPNQSNSSCVTTCKNHIETNLIDGTTQDGDQFTCWMHTNPNCHNVFKGDVRRGRGGCSGCRTSVCTATQVN